MDINFDVIYEELVKNGFYDNIKLRICDKNRSNNSINIPATCKSRLNGITEYNKIKMFKFLISPCRVGRNSSYCLKKLNGCSIKNSPYSCPLCFSLDPNIQNPCEPLNKLVRIPVSDKFTIIPNMYPYIEKHFLITTNEHIGQIQALNTPKLIADLFTILFNLLSTNNGTVFFNGLCGNSLDHFHCQYTTSKFPIFEVLSDTQEGYFNINGFRGFSIITDNIKPVSKLIKIILKSIFTYNFISRKVNNGLQFVFFIRDCHIEAGVEDLNFGASELAGLVVTSNKLLIDENILDKYLNTTNNEEDYLLVSSKLMNGGRRNKSRKSNHNTLLFRRTMRHKRNRK
jgi:hypothetical protein